MNFARDHSDYQPPTRTQLLRWVGEFVEEHLGHSLDQDGAYGAQCTEVLRQWAMDLYGQNYFRTGDARELPESMKFPWSTYFDKLPLDGWQPQVGDWPVWGPNLSPTGHVALVIATMTTPGEFMVMEQNGGDNRFRKVVDPKTGKTRSEVIQYAVCKKKVWHISPKIQCILRPKTQPEVSRTPPPPRVYTTHARDAVEYTFRDPFGYPVAPAPTEGVQLDPKPLPKVDVGKASTKSGLKLAGVQGSIMAVVAPAIALKDQFLSDIHGVDLPTWMVLVIYGAVALPVIFGVQKRYRRKQMENGG